jgi:hypothetical protein
MTSFYSLWPNILHYLHTIYFLYPFIYWWIPRVMP